MLDWMLTADGWIAFGTLFAMEVVLGVDNIIFIAILASRLPLEQQAKARYIGLSIAVVMRIALLLALTWIMGLTKPLFAVAGLEITGKDIVLILGGFFLITKATIEIHHMMEGRHEQRSVTHTTMEMAIAQIVVIDLVFALDSIITAVGLTQNLGIMIAAVLASVAVMMVASGPVSEFVNRHPTTKMLALAFLVMIGAMLVANGFGIDVPKGYIYSAMAFSVLVEALNVTLKGRRRAATGPFEASSALDGLLTRAHRGGASQIQIIGDERGAVHVWFAGRDGLVEDREFPTLAWSALKAEIEGRVRARAAVAIDGARHLLKATISAPDMRPAALLTLARA